MKPTHEKPRITNAQIMMKRPTSLNMTIIVLTIGPSDGVTVQLRSWRMNATSIHMPE